MHANGHRITSRAMTTRRSFLARTLAALVAGPAAVRTLVAMHATPKPAPPRSSRTAIWSQERVIYPIAGEDIKVMSLCVIGRDGCVYEASSDPWSSGRVPIGYAVATVPRGHLAPVALAHSRRT